MEVSSISGHGSSDGSNRRCVSMKVLQKRVLWASEPSVIAYLHPGT